MKQYRIIQFDMAKELAHGMCVSNLAYLTGRELGMDEDDCYQLAMAGMVHDVGKLELEKEVKGWRNGGRLPRSGPGIFPRGDGVP